MHPIPGSEHNQNPAEGIIGNVMNFLSQGSQAGYVHPQTASFHDSNNSLQNALGNPLLLTNNPHASRNDHINQHYDSIQPATDPAWTGTTTDPSFVNAQLDTVRTGIGTTAHSSFENSQFDIQAETRNRDRKRRHSPSPP